MCEYSNPYFQGDVASIEALSASPLDVYAHNVETVERLTPFVRDKVMFKLGGKD